MTIALDEKFKWMPQSVTIEKNKISGYDKLDVANICLLNKQTNIKIVHPLNNFIIKYYRDKGLGLQSQFKAARLISQFLNFLYQNIEDDDDDDGLYLSLTQNGLKALMLEHGAKFISHGTYLGINSDTSSYWEQTLTRFYKFLEEQNLVSQQYHIKTDYDSKRKKHVYLSPFTNSIFDVSRPNPDEDTSMETLKDFGDYRVSIAKIFIQIASVHAQDIALGIYFQYFGGLRSGEACNLSLSAIKPNGLRNGDGGFWVSVKDRQNILFPHLANKEYVQVKRPREQFIIESPMLQKLFDEQKSRLDSLKSKGKLLIPDSLFVSAKSGLPIDGQNYAKKFKRVKNIFEEQIKNSRDPKLRDCYDLLKSKPWSTHIGRAVFTNMLIDLNMSIADIANARGDKNYSSAIAYLERRTSRERVKQLIEKMSKVYGMGNTDDDDELNFAEIRQQKIETYNRLAKKAKGLW